MYIKFLNIVNRILAPGQNANSSAMSIFVIRVAGAGVAYISQILLARWISPHDNGVYVQYISFISIFLAFIIFGFDNSPQYFIPKYKKSHDYERLIGYISTARYSSIIISCFFVLISLIATQLIPMSNDMANSIILTFMIGIPWSLIEVQGGIARCWNWVKLAVAPGYFLRFFLLCVVVGLGIVFDHNATYVHALAFTLAATSLACLVQTIFLHRHLKAEFLEKNSEKNKIYEFKEWFGYNIPICLSSICVLIIAFSDVLILGRFVTAENVAIYYIASKTIIIANFILFAVGIAYSHRFSEAALAQDLPLLQTLMHNAIRAAFVPTVLASLGLIITGGFLLSLFGEVYSQGYVYLVMLSLVPVIRASIGPADRLMMMAKAQNQMAKNLVIIVFITVFLQLTMAWYYGAMGIVIATLAAAIIEVMIFRNSVKKILGIETFLGKIIFESWNASKRYLHLQRITSEMNFNTPDDVFSSNIFYQTEALHSLVVANPIAANEHWLYTQTHPHNPNYSGVLPVNLRMSFVLNSVENLKHSLSVLGTPIVSSGYGAQFILSLFENAKMKWNTNFISLHYIPDEFGNYEHIMRACAQVNGTIIFNRHYKRALLDTTIMPYDGYVSTFLSGRKRKELRRQERQLNALDPIYYTCASTEADIQAAFAEFIELESNGWKGKSGTSMKLREQDYKFVKSFIDQLSVTGGVKIFAMRNSQTILAMGIVLFSGTAAYYYKTSYDEAFKRYSPGVLLTLHITKQIMDMPNITYIDACSIPNHSMIDQLWKQRREMFDISISLHNQYDPRTWLSWCIINFGYYGRISAKNTIMGLRKMRRIILNKNKMNYSALK